MNGEPDASETTSASNGEMINQLQARNKGLIAFVVILCVLLLLAIGYVLWQRYGALPLEITSVGVSYTAAHSTRIITETIQVGDSSRVIVTAHTKPGAICQAVVQGRTLASKLADDSGNVSWETQISGRVGLVSVVVNASLGNLKASRATTYDVPE